VTGAWDDKIKLWSLMDDMSRMTYQEHQYCIYATIWSPNNESVFASASGDYTVKVWDINGELPTNQPVLNLTLILLTFLTLILTLILTLTLILNLTITLKLTLTL